jgi:hypothetical protein
MLLRNDEPSMDKKNNQWRMMHGKDNKLARIEDDPTSADFRTLKSSNDAWMLGRILQDSTL